MRRLWPGLRLWRGSRCARCGAEAVQGRVHDSDHEARLRGAVDRYDQPLRRPRLRGRVEDIDDTQRRDAQMLRIRRQGMRDPRLGLRRQGLTFYKDWLY